MRDRRVSQSFILLALTLGGAFACGSEGSPSAGTSHDAGAAPSPPPGIGSDAPDGGQTPSEGDAVDAGDASSKAPAPCGAGYCQDDATCVAGACEITGCTGYQVPGDYATVQAAATALLEIGGTICVAAGTYDEEVHLRASEEHPIILSGVSPAKTRIKSFALGGNVRLQGLSTTETSRASGAREISLSNVKLASSSGFAFEVNGNASPRPNQSVRITASVIDGKGGGLRILNAQLGDDHFLVDRCDVTGRDGAGIALEEATSSMDNPPVELTVSNSWIHDSLYGVATGASAGCSGGCIVKAISQAVTLVNDTLTSNGTAISAVSERPGPQKLAYFNVLLHGNELGVRVSGAVVQETGHNLLFGNVANYLGAVDGPAYVKQDPLLDLSVSPPRPKAGSPALGAGDEALAPANDFWGAPRGTKADIGALEAP